MAMDDSPGAVLASAARRGLGISVFASAGNRVDVSGNDCMQYWIDDESTDTVGLYQTGAGNFFLRNSNTPGAAAVVFGFGPPAGMTPVRGDWNNL